MAGQMASQTSKLLRREEVAEGAMAFHFEKPSEFKFKAGQFADVTLIDPTETDAEGNTRTFSIASPPFENELVFTTRMRDTAFKRSLKKVPLATEVTIRSAAGSFTLHKSPANSAHCFTRLSDHGLCSLYLLRDCASRPHREPGDPPHEVPTSLARIGAGLLHLRVWDRR
jgi:hypothetical protein